MTGLLIDAPYKFESFSAPHIIFFTMNLIQFSLHIRPVTDFNEITYHFAECIYVHCYNTKLRVWYKLITSTLCSLYSIGRSLLLLLKLCLLPSTLQKLQGAGQVPGNVSTSAINTPSKGYQSAPNQVKLSILLLNLDILCFYL